ncbi:hypothetical protein BRC81_17255 [Halobacteriales archaeon QS_1_68_20]|nr:MAG: hypothetical protein BRC81_17255 [Halobacteriales archaeon QS_1_68_20]
MSTTTLLLVGSAVFFTILAGIGFVTSRWIGHTEDFLVAGRQINWYVVGLAIAAMAWSSGFFALFSKFAIHFGFFAALSSMIATAIGYYVYGVYFTPFARTLGSQSIGEFFEMRYDVKTRTVVSLYLGLAMMIFLPATSLGVAFILKGYAGLPIIQSATGMILIIFVICIAGGLWGAAITDLVQAVIGYGTLAVVFGLMVTQVGGYEWLVNNVPEASTAFAFPGRFGFGLGADSYVTWILLWGAMVLFGSPYYWLLANAPRSDADAKNGFRLASAMVFFLAFFVSLLPLYAYGAVPEQFQLMGGQVPAEGAVGVVAHMIPSGVGALLMVTVIASNVSSQTTTSLGGIAAWSRDVYQRLFRPDADPHEMLVPTRIITVVFFVVGWALVFVGDIQALLGVVLTILGISALILLAGALSKSITPTSASSDRLRWTSL